MTGGERRRGRTADDMRRERANEIGDLINTDGLPEDKWERLTLLREAAWSDTWVPTHDPETGEPLEGQDPVALARRHWPEEIPARMMSPEALTREAALYRVAGQTPPQRGV